MGDSAVGRLATGFPFPLQVRIGGGDRVNDRATPGRSYPLTLVV